MDHAFDYRCLPQRISKLSAPVARNGARNTTVSETERISDTLEEILNIASQQCREGNVMRRSDMFGREIDTPLAVDREATFMGDLERVKRLVQDAYTFGLQSNGTCFKKSSHQCLYIDLLSVKEDLAVSTDGRLAFDEESYHFRAENARVTITTGKRWLKATSSRRPNAQRLIHFDAKVTCVPLEAKRTMALSVHLRQTAQIAGLLSLTPAITSYPVVPADSQVFKLVDRGDTVGVQQLLRAGLASIRDSDPFGRNFLHYAAWNSSAKMWEMLIKEGCDINALTMLSTSPLSLCVGIDYRKKLRIALEAGADPTLHPVDGQKSVLTLQADALRTILNVAQYSIDLKIRNTTGRTLFLSASAAVQKVDQAEILEVLLKAGANINDRDSEGNSCLHILLNSVQPLHTTALRAVSTLFKAGADPFALNNHSIGVQSLLHEEDVEYGSYKRDLWTAACEIAGLSAITMNERNTEGPCFTNLYGAAHHQDLLQEQASMLSQGRILPSILTEGGRDIKETSSIHGGQHLQRRLISRLWAAADCTSTSGRRLHEASASWAMERYCHNKAMSEDRLFDKALQYLRRMLEGKRQLVLLIKEILPFQSWAAWGRRLDWLRLADESETAALLQYDWSKAVKPVDVFRTHAVLLTETLKSLKSRSPDPEAVMALISVLERAHQDVAPRELSEANDKIGGEDAHNTSSASKPASLEAKEYEDNLPRNIDCDLQEQRKLPLARVDSHGTLQNLPRMSEAQRAGGVHLPGPDTADIEACLAAGEASKRGRQRPFSYP